MCWCVLMWEEEVRRERGKTGPGYVTHLFSPRVPATHSETLICRHASAPHHSTMYTPGSVDTHNFRLPFMSRSTLVSRVLTTALQNKEIGEVSCVVSHFCMAAEQVTLEFLVLWYWDIEWRWHLLKMLRCGDVSSMSSLHR